MPPPGFVTLLTHAHFPTYLEQTGELVELSNQQLIDCSWPAGNRGCRGGFQDRTLKWVKRNGVALRRDYGPYLAQVSFCYCLGLLQLFKGWQYVNSSQNPNSLTMHKQKSLYMICQPKLPVEANMPSVVRLSLFNLRKNGQRKRATCFAKFRVGKRCCRFYYQRTNLSRYKSGCCRMRNVVAKSRTTLFFL